MTRLTSQRLLAIAVTLVAVVALVALSAPSTTAQTTLSPYEQQVFDLVNQQRAANGLQPLTLDARLVNAARAHNAKMIQTNEFSHQVTGEQPLCATGASNDRYDAVGYPWTMCAENIAAGQTTPQQVMNDWMNSSGHRANILNPNLKNIGIGYTTGGSYGVYWTEDFGTSSGGSVPPPTSTTPAPSPTTPTPTKTPAPTATPAPTSDRVSITQASYLTYYHYVYVRATSSSAAATLRVYNGQTGTLLGTLSNNGGGNYSGYVYAAAKPGSISVRSSLGGSATANVQ